MEKLFDRYLIEQQIGEGGFGRVYLAQDTVLPRRAAIKELKARFLDDEMCLRRFANDARVAASLGHANIVTVYDLQPPQSPRYIVMEYLPRGSLHRLLTEQGQLALSLLLRTGIDLCKGLEAAHRRGVIHRDLKPENVLIADDGTAKLCDFGVAHVPAELGGFNVSVHPSGHPGDLRYMSPEQVRGRTLDGRSDLYTLGAVLYQLATGRHYFDTSQCRSAHDFASAILESVPPSPRQWRPDMPLELEELIRRLLSKNPDQRLQSAGDVLGVLQHNHASWEQVIHKVRLVSAMGSYRLEGTRTRYQITIEGRNEGSQVLNLSGLTINVPSIDSPSLYADADIQKWNIGTKPPFQCGPGELVWGFLNSGVWAQKPAPSLLIESVVDTWKPGDKLTLDAVLVTDLPQIGRASCRERV